MAFSKSDVVILAGGLGTRLREVVSDRPKPLAPIRGRPFLDLLLEQLAASGCVSRAILAIGYQAEKMVDYYQQVESPLPLVFSVEKELLGTGGALRLAMPLIKSPTVLVVNGDTFVSVNYRSFYSFHEEKKSELTLAAIKAEGNRYGSIDYDPASHKLKGFFEKQEDSREKWVSAGLYLMRTNLLENLESNKVLSLEKDVFPAWVNRASFCFPLNASFIDIGTKESYMRAQSVL